MLEGEIPSDLALAGDGALDDSRLDHFAIQRDGKVVANILLCKRTEALDGRALHLEEDAGTACRVRG